MKLLKCKYSNQESVSCIPICNGAVVIEKSMQNSRSIGVALRGAGDAFIYLAKPKVAKINPSQKSEWEAQSK